MTDITFAQLGLHEQILDNITSLGYESPSPIQAQSIPALLSGKDVLGTAQTGTGKTAAFMLPALHNLDLNVNQVQVLVLAPTRELAIQVAEAGQKYSRNMRGFHILPVYGGAPYKQQLRALERGAQIVVGTPGRVIDHLNRGSLKLDALKLLVLDEADEMLRMGFIDDVESILQHVPKERQTALFSATMPPAIKRICQDYLVEPEQISIKAKTQTVERIKQRFWVVRGIDKVSALTRVLDAEDYDAAMIFCGTKVMTTELAERLQARGHNTVALNGDMDQDKREKVLKQFKSGKIDIITATDVAARGIDVERVSHVINFDISRDVESYVHRIGRTGRAGREGQAIVFVRPQEMRMLRTIERVTKQKIDEMALPTNDEIKARRFDRLIERLHKTAEEMDQESALNTLERIREGLEMDENLIEAAMLQLIQDFIPLEYQDREPSDRPPRRERDRDDKRGQSNSGSREMKPRRRRGPSKQMDMDTYRMELGRVDQVRPGDIVGAIANEIDLQSDYIGEIVISERNTTVQLPSGMPKEVFQQMQKLRVRGKPMRLTKI